MIYATKLFEEILRVKDKVESINMKDFMETGKIEITLKNLEYWEKENLGHMACGFYGRLIDDRY